MAKKQMTVEERLYVGRVKELPCSCCGAAGPSDAHHAREGQGGGQRGGHYCTVALCKSCHQTRNGIHGEKIMMRIMKLTEMDMLDITIGRIFSSKII